MAFSVLIKKEECGGNDVKVRIHLLMNNFLLIIHMGVSKNSGTSKWMVKIMENPIKMGDLGVPSF